ncbi:hypothetical protein GPK34_00610 [Secundilactobacillus kimchicus]|uniref:hypothetical protein n=1 Tax=Secundilactobacillus kimchicus TaxID=528209 RepID=UPI001C0326E8|nr:hypothetical protein [Secundilactobacillus kimchicus]MBT9670539.1 hypothetical protein [Secundilactobacillus kimchicus]
MDNKDKKPSLTVQLDDNFINDLKNEFNHLKAQSFSDYTIQIVDNLSDNNEFRELIHKLFAEENQKFLKRVTELLVDTVSTTYTDSAFDPDKEDWDLVKAGHDADDIAKQVTNMTPNGTEYDEFISKTLKNFTPKESPTKIQALPKDKFFNSFESFEKAAQWIYKRAYKDKGFKLLEVTQNGNSIQVTYADEDYDGGYIEK